MANLYRTITSTNSSWTFSTWMKVSINSSNQYFFQFGGDSGSSRVGFYINGSTKAINMYVESTTTVVTSTNLVNDTGAWYHVVIKNNAGTGTVYVNGTALAGSLASFTCPSLSAAQLNVGYGFNTLPWYGGLAHTHLADGTAYDPTTFAETDATSGIWIAKSGPSVTYGTDGFFLKYASGAITTDSSGNGNTMTQSGTITANKDNPDNNFATWNPLYNSNTQTFSNGNTTLSGSGSANYASRSASTLCMLSGKWYAEFKVLYGATNMAVGVGNIITDGTNAGADSNPTSDANAVSLASGNLYNNGVETSSYYTAADGDIYGIAVDKDNDKVYFSQNGTWLNSSDPAAGTNPASTGLTYDTTFLGRSLAGSWKANFGNGYFGTTAVSTGNADAAGNGTFEYAVPTGYYALCTNNLGDQS